jgi:hypothetical protein
MDNSEARDFTYKCHERLARKLGMYNSFPRIPPHVEVSNIDEKADHVRKTFPKLRDEMMSEYENVSRAFNAPITGPSKLLALENYGLLAVKTKIASAAYDSENHAIDITLYPDVKSVVKFYSNLGFNLGSHSQEVVESSTRLLPEKIAECIGYYLRAEAAGYARSNSDKEKILVGEKTGFLSGGRAGFSYDNLKDPNRMEFIRSKGFKFVGALDVSGFFGPIGVLECAEDMKYSGELVPSAAYSHSKELERDLSDGRRSFMTSSRKNAEEAQRLAIIQVGLPAKFMTSWYNKDPKTVRKVLYDKDDPMIRWPAMRLAHNFINAGFVDMDDILEGVR